MNKFKAVEKKPLQYGLNIQSKKPKNPIKTSIFNNDEDDEEVPASSVSVTNKELARNFSFESKKTKKQQEEALEIDSSVFDYDGVYDEMKGVERRRQEQIRGKQGNDAKKPRYIEGLLRSAEIRKKDLLRAEERMIQHERETEGDEFADKEKFVTSAYKQQQEEMRKWEEEERRRAAEEDITAKKDLTGFYRNLLNKTTASREEAIKASLDHNEKPKSSSKENVEEEGADEASKEIAEAIASGKNITLNDDNQIVDKRQLLSAGLNVNPKVKKASREEHARDRRYSDRRGDERHRNSKGHRSGRHEDERSRLSREIEEQIRQSELRKKEQEQAKVEAITAKMARSSSEQTISDAKARYLARKAAAKNKRED
ncbi:hypothetical protein K493DRAFT_337277 [Basidiobolus meristosporus CBS 931.73]|uniref:Nuclear speckle splicing regulatory protein 1 N-terminal domain-containing protein n=1 Tax=Basidiobolus meristosporus CBS 931.73 TaxID=1314790 RepID=A0A1Y1YCI8_9FUNG|nr:hypothetical protein K493DRAFT_337277 [Basidiobolus meristosporus CBS 931.73]|eukprot:ORX95643.1 hypothetical protein K493DRAFT_337277 [Basidiobolus meristosporus CBS 931.73]